MLVSELIELLSKCDPNAVCNIWYDGDLLAIVDVDNTFEDLRVDLNADI